MKRWFSKKRHSIPTVLLALGLVMALVATVSPWPSALLIRSLFEVTAVSTVKEMEPHVPASGIDATRDISYGDAAANTTLDVFSPSGSTGALPTVVWIHGGAWISGDKSNVDPYLQILSSNGYTTVGVNYTVAPEAEYPVALTQLNEALAFLIDHAAEYRIDPDRIIIAGDSAGAQYTAQLATMVTSPTYATLTGLTPALKPEQLRAVLLNCGIYDVSGIPNAPGLGGWGFRVSLWAYLGTKDWSNTTGGELMSTLDDVTGDFPTTWITGGNGDPLTAGPVEADGGQALQPRRRRDNRLLCGRSRPEPAARVPVSPRRRGCPGCPRVDDHLPRPSHPVASGCLALRAPTR